MKTPIIFANNLGKLCILCMGLAYWLAPLGINFFVMFAVFAVFRVITLRMAGWSWFSAPLSYTKVDRHIDAVQRRWNY